MKTVVTRSPEEAAAFVRAGEVVAFPTETVYGLGAAVFDECAVAKVFEAKERPPDNPLIAHVASVDKITTVVRSVPPAARRLVDAFFPGPLTLVLEKHPRVPFLATAGLDTVGVRMPAHDVALRFLAACGVPVAAPSANRSGRPSPTTYDAVAADLDGRIACILAADATRFGLESTVVDCRSSDPIVLRAGAVTLEQLRAVVPTTALGGALGESETPRSPGAKYRHYSPRARVVVVHSLSEPPTRHSAYIGLDSPPDAAAWTLVRVCTSVDEYAHELFSFFRAADAAGVSTVFCQEVPPIGLGLALMDRISRAAHD